MHDILNKEEKKNLESIVKKYYMASVLNKLENVYFKKYGVINSLSYLHELILSCKDDNEKLLMERKDNGKIVSLDQARKSVVGNIFPSVVIYIFLQAKKSGLVDKNLFLTSKTSNARFEEYVTIHVGEETQKPDMDLVFYKVDNNDALTGCVIVSLKTSLRERAGQTYKWKLLLEIASTNNSIKDKYKIKFNVKKTPKVCFATINFYDEINQPQHRGMFQFFDGSFIGKPVENTFIKNLSDLFLFAQENT